MDQRAIDALVAAGLNNRLQAFGVRKQGEGACAMWVIQAAEDKEAEEAGSQWTLEPRWVSCSGLQVFCPHCGTYYTEEQLIIHCNDAHRWDFLTIARKLEHLIAPPH